MIAIGDSSNVESVLFHDGETVRHVEKRLLIGAAESAPNFAMRRFTLGTGGQTPYHAHQWEHEVYVLAGTGAVRFAGGSRQVGPGNFVLVPPMDEHQFVNMGKEPFEFLCVVPLEGEG
jgi:quercetin dioxygenase-like cupin family protein